jgi:hypothetical protein
MADVLITPVSGLVEFKDNGGAVDAIIQLDGSGNLNITHPGGNLNLGNAGAPVYIGNGVASVDVIFEQNGAVRALTGKTLTLGQTDSFVTVNSSLQINRPTTVSDSLTATRLISNVATGTAPLTVASTTVVTNLNADLLDGLNSTAFAQLSGATFTGAISGTSLTLSGDLTVNGTTTTINSTTLTVDDKNIELGSVASPTDATADGGGITLKGATDKTFNWVSATGYWTANNSISAPRFVSTQATGTAPLVVASTTLVTNLNANLLDGAARDATWAAAVGNNIPVRHPDGYLYANYFNTPADKTTGVPSHIAIQTNSDNYIRWNTFAQFRTNLGIIDPITLAASLRANVNISGGGTITVNGSGSVLWSTRFIVISNGRGTNFATAGYFDINCPVSGTITGVGGAGNQTATAAGIPLGDWHALYYILPIGSSEGTVAANFRIVTLNSNLDIPHNWVLICLKNADTGYFHFPNGINLKVNQNSTNLYPNGGTFTGNASTATSAGSVTNAVTFNTAGAGDASGTTYNGSAARTISYNTIGAPAYAQVAGSNFDFNTIFPATTTLNRVVWNSGDGNMLNSPNGNSTGVLLASQGSHGLWNAQMFFEQGSAGSMFIRGSDDASGTRAWGAWKRLITAADTGTVSTTMLATVNSNVGSFGSASSIPVITVNAKGLVTAVSTSAVSIPSGSISVTGGDLTLSGTTGTAITNATLATVNSNVGSFGSATSVPVLTVNAKGLVTAVSTATVTSLPTQTSNAGKFLTTNGTTASWTSTTAAAGGGIQVNNSTISTTYTIPAGQNGFSVGPITVANGTAITVSSGQRWVVI